MTISEAIKFLRNCQQGAGYTNVLTADRWDIAALIESLDEQIKKMWNPMNCANGHDSRQYGWCCGLDHACCCANCSEWEG